MLKQTINYTNYNGQRRTKDFYFNLNKLELAKLTADVDGMSFQEYMQRIAQEQDMQKLLDLIKEVILMSYGEKSEDGEEFVKTPEIRAKFENSPAFIELYMSMFQDTDAAVRFMTGVLPPDLRFTPEQLKEQRKQARLEAKRLNRRNTPDPLNTVVADPIGEDFDADLEGDDDEEEDVVVEGEVLEFKKDK